MLASAAYTTLGCKLRACHEDPETGQGVAHLGPGEETLLAEKVLLATGRQPNVDCLGLEAAGVNFDPRRGIAVDEYLQTSAPGVSAIGDLNGLSTLADAALAQAGVAVENALGARVAFDPARAPRCVHTDPAAAEVGLSEIAARAVGTNIGVGRARFGAVTPVLNQGEGAGGWVKLIADSGTRRLLGAVVVGERAAEWIGEFSLALILGASVDALVAAPRAHASFADALEVCARKMQRAGSFTVTLETSAFFDQMQHFSGNAPGIGGLNGRTKVFAASRLGGGRRPPGAGGSLGRAGLPHPASGTDAEPRGTRGQEGAGSPEARPGARRSPATPEAENAAFLLSNYLVTFKDSH